MLAVMRYVVVNADGSVARLNAAGGATRFTYAQWSAAARHARLVPGTFVATRDGDGAIRVVGVK